MLSNMTPRMRTEAQRDPRRKDDSVPPEVRLPPVILPKSVQSLVWRKTICDNALVPFADISSHACRWEDEQLL